MKNRKLWLTNAFYVMQIGFSFQKNTFTTVKCIFLIENAFLCRKCILRRQQGRLKIEPPSPRVVICLNQQPAQVSVGKPSHRAAVRKPSHRAVVLGSFPTAGQRRRRRPTSSIAKIQSYKNSKRLWTKRRTPIPLRLTALEKRRPSAIQLCRKHGCLFDPGESRAGRLESLEGSFMSASTLIFASKHWR